MAGADREVSAGGVLVRPAPGGPEVCLILRHRHGEAVWGLPKGHLEPSEDPLDTARREVAEETGWVGDVVQRLGEIRYQFTAPATGRRVEKAVTFYLMRCAGSTGREPDPREVDAVQWLPFDQAIATVAYDNERDVLRTAQRALAVPPPAGQGR